MKERNLLVHRLLANFDPNSVESCEKLICVHDEQVDRLEPHYESLIGVIGNMQTAQKEIMKQFEAQLRQGAREDGNVVSP